MASKSRDSYYGLVEESSDYQTDDSEYQEDELDLPFDKLNLNVPKKKLIVLCLGGLLVHRVHSRDKASVRGLKPDFVNRRFSVFKRPLCTEFLNFCFQRFEVGLWSSAKDHNIEAVLTNITGDMRRNILFVWSQDECTDSGIGCLGKEEKPLFLKELKDLWDYLRFHGKYSASNTLLIDDEPHTCLLNPPNTAIFPKPYKKHDLEDTFLGPDGEFCKFLDGLADAEDVPSYVKDHRIGQPEITPSHPDWDYYAAVVRQFRSKKEDEEAAESSSK